jgi:hypothetical protein
VKAGDQTSTHCLYKPPTLQNSPIMQCRLETRHAGRGRARVILGTETMDWREPKTLNLKP